MVVHETAGAEIGVCGCQIEREEVEENEEAAARCVQPVELRIYAVDVGNEGVAGDLIIGQVRVVADIVCAVEDSVHGVRGAQRGLEVALAGARVDKGLVGKERWDFIKIKIGEGGIHRRKSPGRLKVAAYGSRDGIVVEG